MDEVNYMYDGKFEGNILNVGRTGRGKTTFVQNLGKNKLFGETNWTFQRQREKNIRNCF